MKDTNQLPPHTITINDHPEPHIMQWSDLELAAVKRYAEQYALQARAQVQGHPSWWMRATDEGAEWTDTAPLVLSGWTPLYTTQQPATTEPVGFTYQAEIDYANSTGGNGSFWRVPPDLDDDSVPLYNHPAPSVPGDVVRVPLQVLKDASEALGNFVSDHGWGDADMQAMDNLDAYIARHEANRAAMLAAKEAK